VLHHLTQAIGGARHRDVRNFAEGGALQLGQRGEMARSSSEPYTQEELAEALETALTHRGSTSH
jgi:hypothetical protein